MEKQWTNEEIINEIKSIRSDTECCTEKEMTKKYETFSKTFPKLYMMSLTPHMNYEMLYKMLNYRKKAVDENIPDMIRDVTIGEMVSEKYIYPIVGEPSLEQKKKAAKIVAKKYNDIAKGNA